MHPGFKESQLLPIKDLFCNHKLEFDFTLQTSKQSLRYFITTRFAIAPTY
jgi:hypothetical protein